MDINIGDKVAYIGIYSSNFPITGIVEEIKDNNVKIKLDEPILHSVISIQEVKKIDK